MNDVTLIVPAESASVFHGQAVFGVQGAASALAEAASRINEGRATREESDLASAITYLDRHTAVCDRTPDGTETFEVSGDRRALAETVQGCLGVWLDELSEKAVARSPEFAAMKRLADQVQWAVATYERLSAEDAETVIGGE